MDFSIQSPDKPILITGAHRSGSTWVGRMIAVDPSIVYIQEPFNVQHDMGICGARFDYWFPYITNENSVGYHKHISNTINFRYNFQGKLKSKKPWNSFIKGSSAFLMGRLFKRRPLLKDPIALFSTEWLASTFNIDVVVLIRHPAAFAGSLKVKNWTHPFSHFLYQPLLMKDHLSIFQNEVERFAEEQQDIVDQAALLWKIIHSTISIFKKKHPDWLFIRHEDISTNPILAFREIYNNLGIEFTKKVEDIINWHSTPSRSKNPQNQSHNSLIKRDSYMNIKSWKTRLSDSEVARVKKQVEGISEEFYSEQEW